MKKKEFKVLLYALNNSLCQTFACVTSLIDLIPMAITIAIYTHRTL